MELPTGRQHTLVFDAQEAVITEVGATLRTYRVGDTDIVEGFGPADEVAACRGQTLLPWPNRVADGRWSWAGRELQLALSEPDRSNAIHGLVRWANWELVELQPSAVLLQHRLRAQQGWPFLLDCQVGYALSPIGLVVTTSVVNVGPTAAPVAHGAHPYLAAGGRVDDCQLHLPADVVLETDDRLIPTRELAVTDTAYDFRVSRQFGDTQLDHCFTGLQRGSDGRWQVTVRRPDGWVVGLWGDPKHPYLQVFSGDALTGAHHRSGFAVEPMTSPPNALATGTDLVVLDPGERVELRWGITATRTSGGEARVEARLAASG